MTVLFASVDCGNIAVADMYSFACRHSVACISCASGASCSWLSIAVGCRASLNIAAWLFIAFVGSNILVISLTDFAQAFGVMTCMGETVNMDCSGTVGAEVAWSAWLLELMLALSCGGGVVSIVCCVAVASICFLW